MSTSTRSGKMRLVAIGVFIVLVITILTPPIQAYAQTAIDFASNPFSGIVAKTIGKIGDIAADAFLAPFGWVSLLVLQFATYLTGITGAVLNYVIDFSVVHMAERVSGSEVITDSWRTVRDVANMGFIFILLYTSIKMILGLEKGIYRLIKNIIIAAILINFSLFLTKLVIDAANVLAITFYSAIAPAALDSTHTILNSGISNSMMEPMRLSSIAQTVGAFDGKQLIIAGIMGTIFALTAAFVFMAVAIMFIIRLVVLIFVLILSPLAFVANIFPGLDEYAKQWRGALVGQAFFAPIYFLLTWIVIKISQGLFNADPSANLGDVITGSVKEVGGSLEAVAPSAGSIGLIMNFIIVIAFLVISLVVAKSWANKAGGGVNKLTNWAMGTAGGAVLGTTGFLSRHSVGRLADARLP
jgi:hypothetical protein